MNLHSHRAQLVVTALTASCVTAGLFQLYTSYSKRVRRRNLELDTQRYLAAFDEDKNPPPRPEETFLNDRSGYDEELIKEQLARNYTFFGAEGMRKIRMGTVVIVGCGGVGSWAAVMLVRS